MSSDGTESPVSPNLILGFWSNDSTLGGMALSSERSIQRMFGGNGLVSEVPSPALIKIIEGELLRCPLNALSHRLEDVDPLVADHNVAVALAAIPWIPRQEENNH